jgi:MYXO-CTERM domain-containing protein
LRSEEREARENIMNRLTSRHVLAAGCALAMCLPACSGGGPGSPTEADDHLGTTSEALSGNDAVARGALWVAAQVPYCQSANGQPDPDNSCSSVCMRPSNADWDPYRSDCSGFVSWAWNLPAPGRTTSEFAPAVNDITQAIDGNSLEPGDALNVPGDHIVLFVAWIVPGQSATFYEEPGCSANPPYAHEFTSNVEISGSSVTVDYEANTFTAIRYSALTGTVADAGPPPVPDAGGGTPCSVPGLGSGECILTSACAALPNHVSTPNYCPGAADIECCTGPMTDDAGAPPGQDSGSPPPPAADSGTGPGEVDSGSGSLEEDSGEPGSDSGTTDHPGTGSPNPDAPFPSAGANGCSAAPLAASGSHAGIWLAGLALVALRRRKRS